MPLQAARPTLLVATSERAAPIVQLLLGEVAELLYAHTLAQACDALLAGRVHAIVAGLHFDDSLMPLLLDRVKADPRTRSIPFHCCRFLPTQLKPASLAAVQRACKELASHGYIDLPEWQRLYGEEEAARRFARAILASCEAL